MSDRSLPPALSTLLDKASRYRKTGDQLVFSGSLQDPIPRHLIVDPDLPALAVRIWAFLRINIQDNHTPSACPTYIDIMRNLDIGSKSTVSINLNLLRATRWLSVKEKTTDSRGYFSGSIYILHTEPVSVADAIVLDEEYMQILFRLKSHTNNKYHRLAKNLISSAEALFDSSKASSLEAIDQRIDADQARSNTQEPKPSSLGMFYQRTSTIKTVGSLQSIVGNKVNAKDAIETINDKNDVSDDQKSGRGLAAFSKLTEKAVSSAKSPISGNNETKYREKQGGQGLATLENHPSPKTVLGPESNNRTAFCSSSSFNKSTTNNNKENKEKEVIAEQIQTNDYDFHDRYLKFTDNQKKLAQVSLARIDTEYRQMVLDEIAARTKMFEEQTNPSQKTVGSALAYVKWQCNEIIDGRNALTGRHPGEIKGGTSDKEQQRKKSEGERYDREKIQSQLHDERIARWVKKQNEQK